MSGSTFSSTGLSETGTINSGVQTFSQLWGDNAGFGTGFTIDMPTANTRYLIADASLTGSLTSNGCTVDAATGKVTVSLAGYYYVDFSLSLVPGAGDADHYHIHVMINGSTEIVQSAIEQQFANATDVQTIGRGFIVLLAASDYIQIHAHTDSNSRSLVIGHYKFSAHKLV